MDSVGRVQYFHLTDMTVVNISITIIFFVSLVALCLQNKFYPEEGSFCKNINGSPLEHVFQSNSHYAVLAACMVSVTIAFMMGINLLFDFFLKDEIVIDDRLDRFEVLCFTFCPIAIISMYFTDLKEHIPNRASWFIWMYAKGTIQNVSNRFRRFYLALSYDSDVNRC